MSRLLDENMTIYDRYICKYWDIILLVFIIALAALLRSGLLSVPLERDEGEYAYTAQLILQGIPPYAEAYSMKMPGIYGVYAVLLTVFGKTHTGIHLGLLVVNLVTIFLLFIWIRRAFDPLTAVVASASFAVLSVNHSVQGASANAEHFVILAAVGGTLLLEEAISSERSKLLFWSGLLFGIASIIKQHGLAFAAFATVYLLTVELNCRPVAWSQSIFRLFLFAIGVSLPFGLICLFFWNFGVFDKFWFWTFTYAREYVAAVPFLSGMELLKEQVFSIISSSIFVFILAVVGFFCVFWKSRYHSKVILVLLFTAFSWVAVCAGFYFRPHYFVLALPSIALLSGICISSLYVTLRNKNIGQFSKLLVLILILIPLFHSVYYERDYLFHLVPRMVSRRLYGANPFPESLEIARYIRENSSENHRIAVIGSEPQIYFYANRRAATRYLYTYPLMDSNPYALDMQKEMISEIESARPEFLIFVNVRSSWLVRPTSEKMIFNWFRSYEQKYYKTIGVIDLVSPEKTISHWRDAGVEYSPRSRYWLAIFRRKSETSSQGS